jgi:hypothetical protein
MTVRRSPFSIGRLLRVACTGLLLVASVTGHADGTPMPLAAASAAAAAVPAPEVAVRAFYSWYLAQLVANKDPWHSDRATLRRHVSPELLGEIQRKMESADGLEADYFIQAQDYDDDWPNHVAATLVLTQGKTAKVNLALGASAARPWKLTER